MSPFKFLKDVAFGFILIFRSLGLENGRTIRFSSLRLAESTKEGPLIPPASRIMFSVSVAKEEGGEEEGEEGGTSHLFVSDPLGPGSCARL